MDTCEYQTWIEAEVPRVQCSQHGCAQVSPAWASRQSCYTKKCEIWHTIYHPQQSAKTWRVWIEAARQTGICALRGVANQIETRLWGILNAMRLRVSNADAEALNSQIRAMCVKARGYRNKARFTLGILFHYGKLDMTH